MVAVIINRPAIDKPGVIPVDKPTVPKAEKVSKRRSRNLNSSVIVSTKTTMPISPTASVTTTSALYICWVLNSLPNAPAYSFPLIELHIVAMSIPKVFTLMPPAVEPEAPPMNIRRMVKKSV